MLPDYKAGFPFAFGAQGLWFVALASGFRVQGLGLQDLGL